MPEIINYQNIYKYIIFKIFQEKNIVNAEDFIQNISKYLDNKDNIILYEIAEQFNIIKIDNKWRWKWLL